MDFCEEDALVVGKFTKEMITLIIVLVVSAALEIVAGRQQQRLHGWMQ